MKTISINKSADCDLAQVVDLMTLAFSADAFVRWMYPDPQQYLKCFPDFVRIFAGKAFEQNAVYHTDNYSGAAIWFPPHSKPNVDALAEYLQQTISGQQQEKVFAMFEQTDHYHPNEPHWYLGMLGVDPSRQRQGYGSALLQLILKECDLANQLVYLESSSPGSASVYQLQGFEMLETIQIDDSPPLFPMVRYPKSTTQ
ncbi:MAG: GNAT family N-acetyltransferase [Cyanobacteria bacterium P01_A01_bin.83]